MSIKTVYRVKCDNCGTTAFPRSTAGQARYTANEEGWRVGKGKRGRDLCPECEEKEDGQPRTG
jgi:hypothetical protein